MVYLKVQGGYSQAINCGVLENGLRAPLKGFGVDIRPVQSGSLLELYGCGPGYF